MRDASFYSVTKLPEIRTYENREPNAFKISTSKTHDLNSPGINTSMEMPSGLALPKRPVSGQRLVGVVERQKGSSPRTSTDTGETSTNGMSFRRKKSSFAASTKSTPLLAHTKVATAFKRAASAASEFMRRRMNTYELQNISSLECALAKKYLGGGEFCYLASLAGKVAESVGRSVKSSRMRTWGKGTGCGRL